MDLDLNVHKDGDHSVLEVAGEIDVYTAPKLRERIIELVDEGQYHLVVDLEKVEFLDSTGLGVLVLGPLVIEHEGELVHVAGTYRRRLLALLVSRAGDVVSVDTIVDALWGENPPPTATKRISAVLWSPSCSVRRDSSSTAS